MSKFNKNKLYADMSLFRKLGFDLYWRNLENSENLFKNDYNAILNQEDTLNPAIGIPVAIFEDSNVLIIIVNEYQDKYLEFTNATKVKCEDKIKHTIEYMYFFSRPQWWDKEKQDLLSELRPSLYGTKILHQDKEYTVVNDIHIKNTAVLDEECYEGLKQFNRRIADYKAKQDSSDLFNLNKKIEGRSYKVSFHLLHNLIPQPVIEENVKYMDESDITVVKTNNITKAGLVLSLKERKLIESLLFLISQSKYIHNKAQLQETTFKITRKELKRLVYDKKFRIDKIIQTSRGLSNKVFLFKNKVSNSKYFNYKLDRVFELKEEDEFLYFNFSKSFLKNIRPIEGEGYFTERELGFYDSLSLGRGFNKDMCIYIFLDYLFLLQKQNFEGREKYIKANLKTLINKINLTKSICREGIARAVDRFNKYLALASKLGLIEEVEYSLGEFKSMLKSTESLKIKLITDNKASEVS